jgi:hypothetical protein
MVLIDADNNEVKVPLSDTFGRIDLLENFDDVVRGAMGSKMNFGQYSEEVNFELIEFETKFHIYLQITTVFQQIC